MYHSRTEVLKISVTIFRTTVLIWFLKQISNKTLTKYCSVILRNVLMIFFLQLISSSLFTLFMHKLLYSSFFLLHTTFRVLYPPAFISCISISTGNSKLNSLFKLRGQTVSIQLPMSRDILFSSFFYYCSFLFPLSPIT